jgi:hypothetical protein
MLIATPFSTAKTTPEFRGCVFPWMRGRGFFCGKSIFLMYRGCGLSEVAD